MLAESNLRQPDGWQVCHVAEGGDRERRPADGCLSDAALLQRRPLSQPMAELVALQHLGQQQHHAHVEGPQTVEQPAQENAKRLVLQSCMHAHLHCVSTMRGKGREDLQYSLTSQPPAANQGAARPTRKR